MNSSAFMNTTTTTTSSTMTSASVSTSVWGIMDWLTVVSFAIAMLGVVFRAIPIAIAVKQWHRRRSIRGKVPSKDEEDQEMRDIEDEAGAPLELSASIANSHTTQVVNNYYSFHRGHPVAGLRLPAAAFVRPMSATITSPGAEALLHTRVRAATWSGLRDDHGTPRQKEDILYHELEAAVRQIVELQDQAQL